MSLLFPTRKVASATMEILEDSKKGAINLSRRLICRDCRVDPPNLVDDYKCGDCICGDCGLIIESGLVDFRPEWRHFADDTEDPSRVGSLQNPFTDGPGLDATVIGPARSKGPGANCGALGRAQARQDSDELALAHGRTEITAACHRMELPYMVINTAVALYRRCLEEQLQCGRSHINIIAAVIAQATRECNCERTIDVVAAQISGCEDKEARRAIKAVQKRIDVGRISKVNPGAKIVDVCKRLGLNNKVRLSAEELLRKAHNEGELFGSCKAATKATACVFIAAMLWGHDVDMAAMVRVAGISPMTLKRGYHTIRSHLGRLVDAAEWTRRWGEGLNVHLLQ